MKWEFEDLGEFLTEGAAAAAVEGAFLLLLAARIHHALSCLRDLVEERLARSSETGAPNKGQTALLAIYTVLCGALAFSALSFAFSAIVGDAAFRKMSGNTPPTADVLRAGYENPGAQVSTPSPARTEAAAGEDRGGGGTAVSASGRQPSRSAV